MLGIFWNLAAFVFTISILIIVHESGHFFIARKCGVKVEKFSVGFGKTIWKYIDRYGTEFIIAIIPLGGYVKILDEHVESVTPEMRQHTFNNKTIGQRTVIIVAGSLANFIFAIFIYWIVFILGVP